MGKNFYEERSLSNFNPGKKKKKKERTGATSILRLGLEEWESLLYETM